MAQIPTSNITMAAIATEVGVSTSSISMANLRNNSISYVNSGQTNNNANAAPDNMRDWAGYTHTQDFGTPTYYMRTGTGVTDYGMNNYANAIQNEAWANAATYWYAILNGTTVECYAVPSNTQSLIIENGLAPIYWSKFLHLVVIETARVELSDTLSNNWFMDVFTNWIFNLHLY